MTQRTARRMWERRDQWTRRFRNFPDPPFDENGWIDAEGVCSACCDGWQGPGEYGRCQTVWDHCHKTGFIRGRLCHSCNTMEGYGAEAVWGHWRLTAPHLRHREIYGRVPVAFPLLTQEELTCLPMAELIALFDRRNEARKQTARPAIAAAMERAWSGIFAAGPR